MALFRKKERNDGERTRLRLAPTRRAWLYLALWVAALIFTQALRSTVSSIFFTFVTLLPIASLIYLWLANGAMRVHMISERGRVDKLAPYDYNFRVINEYAVAFPFTEVMLLLPQSDAVRCSERRVRISMAPRESYTVKNTVRFRFRGTYDIGVSCFYVYDLFRMLRLRIDIDSYERVEVLPRRLGMGEDENRTASDSAARTVRLPNSYDKLEVSDVREYRLGDTLKSIHWNLSSKSEELMARDYNTGTTELTCVYCDMTAHFPDLPPKRDTTEPEELADDKDKKEKKKKTKKSKGSKKSRGKASADDGTAAEKNASAEADAEKASAEDGASVTADTARTEKKAERLDPRLLALDEYYADMNEFCADGVVELTIAAVLRELRGGNTVRLMWFDDRASLGAFAYELGAPEDLELIFDLFATAPVLRDTKDRDVSRLAAMAPDNSEVRSIYIVPALDDASVSAFCDMHGATGGNSTTELILFDPEERYLDIDTHREYIDGCRAQLSESGIKLMPRRVEGLDMGGGAENVR